MKTRRIKSENIEKTGLNSTVCQCVTYLQYIYWLKLGIILRYNTTNERILPAIFSIDLHLTFLLPK